MIGMSTSGAAMPIRGYPNPPPSRAGDRYAVALVVVAMVAIILGMVALFAHDD